MQEKQALEDAMKNVRHFFIYWRNGDVKHLIGESDIAAAFNQAGYGGGSIHSVDFYSEMLPSKHYLMPTGWAAKHNRLFMDIAEFEKEIPQLVQHNDRVRSISVRTDDDRVITLQEVIELNNQQYSSYWALYINKDELGTGDIYCPYDFSIAEYDASDDHTVMKLRDFQYGDFGIALKTIVDIARAPDMAINVAADGLEIDHGTFEQCELFQAWNADTRLYILNHYDVDITDAGVKSGSDFADKLLAVKKELAIQNQ